MPSPAASTRVFHFGLYEVDLQEGELRKNGIRVKLQDQPFQILTMLLERPGQTVTREELRHKLWLTDTFVDFDHSLNSSINKLREALGDSSENPRFIETLHKRGYRFIAPVDGSHASNTPALASFESIAAPDLTRPKLAPPAATPVEVSIVKPPKWPMIVIVVSAITLLIASGLEIYDFLRRPAPRPFQNFVITQVTNSGKVKSAAISPDGKYVAFVQNDNGMQSLWLRNLPTGSDAQSFRNQPPITASFGSHQMGISSTSSWGTTRTGTITTYSVPQCSAAARNFCCHMCICMTTLPFLQMGGTS
jgi:DNA-binding winged helix-turn-helix (wHTH) protein